MTDFRRIDDNFWAAPQIAVEDVAEAHARGFAVIVNTRPEGEAGDQIAGDEIEREAHRLGLDYIAIPVAPGGFNDVQVDGLVDALARARGPVLAYCRSGTRSTLLWSLAQARVGRDPEVIAAKAAEGGYDVEPVRPLIAMLSQQAPRPLTGE